MLRGASDPDVLEIKTDVVLTCQERRTYNQKSTGIGGSFKDTLRTLR